MNIKGTVYKVGDVQAIGENGFLKREFIIEYAENPSYPEYVKFELLKDKVGIADEFVEGEEVDVHFNIRGRLWTGKDGIETAFTSLQAWKVYVTKSKTISKSSSASSPDEEDDLPF